MSNAMYRKSQPTPGDVHVDRPLTNISIAFLQDAMGFVADQVFPNIPVAKQSDLYFTFDRGMFNRDQMKKRAPGSESEGVGYSLSRDSYFADVWALHHDIPDQRRANADSPLQPDREATELLTIQALIRRESEWATRYFAAGIWSTNRTGVNPGPPGAGQFLSWVLPASDPIADIESGKQAVAALTGFEPNVLVVSRDVWAVLRNHPAIVDRIKFSSSPNSPAVVNLQAVAAVLEVDRILVSRGIVNSAIEGAANVNAFLLGSGALLVYSAPNPGLMAPSGGYTFSWTGLLGAGAQGQRVSRFRMEHLKSDRIEIEMAFAQKLVAADLGVFFASPIV